MINYTLKINSAQREIMKKLIIDNLKITNAKINELPENYQGLISKLRINQGDIT